MNILQKSLVGAGMILGSYAPLQAQNGIKVNSNFSTVEQAVTDQKQGRIRVILSPSVDYKGMSLQYHGLNEMTDFDSKTFFGRNRLLLGKTGAKNQIILDALINSEGILDTKLGIRNQGLLKHLGGYGFVDVETNKDAFSNIVFYGKPINDKTSVEVTSILNKPYDGKMNNYVELQGNLQLKNSLHLFSRVESFDFKNPVYMFGLTLRK